MAPTIPISGCPRGTGVTPECEISYEGGDDLEQRYKDCKSKAGHASFIPVCDFQPSHLPEEYRTGEMVQKIKDLCDLTVKILIKYISLERPDTFADSDEKYPYSGKMRGSRRVTRYGTGFVRSLDSDGQKSHVRGERCPCPDCNKSDSPKMEYWTLMVGTATHVIFDDSEAACAVVECFFDSEDREGVKTMHGVSLKPRSLEFNSHHSDSCYLNCVTHDRDLFLRLHELCCNYNFIFSMNKYASPLAYIISHPHGCSKRISFGNLIHITSPVDSEHPVATPIMMEEGTRCRLPLYPWSSPGGIDVTAPGGSDSSRDSNLRGDNSPNSSDEMGHKGEKSHDDASVKPGDNRGQTSTDSPSLSLDKELVKHGDSEPLDQRSMDKSSRTVSKDGDTDTKTDEELPLPSEDLDDYSHLGAASLSFQQMLQLSATDSDKNSDLNPHHSVKDGELGEDVATLDPLQNDDLAEMFGGGFYFQPSHAFDFASLFGEDVPLPPVGAFVVLSPELDYHLKTSLNPFFNSRATEFSLQPGKEFLIPYGTTFTLPASANHAKRFATLKPAWFTLPPGSKLTLPCKKEFHLPAEAEFLIERMPLRFSYVTYDMVTCPGSSGAIIHQEGVGTGFPFSLYNFSHFGTLPGGSKRSGLQNLFLVL